MRLNTLWRVPVFCIAASWISYYATSCLGGLFFAVQTAADDGTIHLSADPVRSAIFTGLLFLAVLLLGGLWAFRSMTKAEIAVSAAIASAFYFAITLAQLCIPDFPLTLGFKLATIQNWTGILASFLLKLTNHFPFSVLISNLAPFLFVPFGKRRT